MTYTEETGHMSAARFLPGLEQGSQPEQAVVAPNTGTETGSVASESGSGEIIVGNGETYSNSSSKSVPVSSNGASANPRAVTCTRTEPLNPGVSSAGAAAKLEGAAGRSTGGSHAVGSRPAKWVDGSHIRFCPPAPGHPEPP